jgi:1-acyl-sn-glycerol-3-phosphate acyltransferase
MVRLIPFQKDKLRYAYHMLISLFTRTLVYTTVNLKKRIVNVDGVFDQPSIIICNHNSILDILCTVMLSPKVILLTNKWVWHSPVFGVVVRLAEYYPVDDGAESGIERLQQKIDQGFSILIFPEGTRSVDGKMQRFHKGAFYLAEKLNLGIRPLLIDGTHHGIPKGDFYVNDSIVTLKFLPLITPYDKSFGTTYQERTKSISKYFRNELEILSFENQQGKKR